MYNNIINSKKYQESWSSWQSYQEFTRNPGHPGRIARNPPGILVFLVRLLGFLQEYVGQWKVLDHKANLNSAVPV
jgi:hypothetical protein